MTGAGALNSNRAVPAASPAEQDLDLLRAARGVFAAFRTSYEEGTLTPHRHTAMLCLEAALEPFAAADDQAGALPSRSGAGSVPSSPAPPERTLNAPAASSSGATVASAPPGSDPPHVPAADLTPGDTRHACAAGPGGRFA